MSWWVLILLALVVSFNGLVRSRNQCDNAWSQIDVQLKRCHDLIPNLVERVANRCYPVSSIC